MKDAQWEALLATIRGERITPLPTGFVIDCPWLPNWAGNTILDFFKMAAPFLINAARSV